jgi:hypothetical protein
MRVMYPSTCGRSLMIALPIEFWPGTTSNGPTLYLIRFAPLARELTATALPSGAAVAAGATIASTASMEMSAHPARLTAGGTQRS